jgi:hypothetical protein
MERYKFLMSFESYRIKNLADLCCHLLDLNELKRLNEKISKVKKLGLSFEERSDLYYFLQFDQVKSVNTKYPYSSMIRSIETTNYSLNKKQAKQIVLLLPFLKKADEFGFTCIEQQFIDVMNFLKVKHF